MTAFPHLWPQIVLTPHGSGIPLGSPEASGTPAQGPIVQVTCLPPRQNVDGLLQTSQSTLEACALVGIA